MINTSGLEHTSRGPLVLLFFDGYDVKAKPGVVGSISSQTHHWLRHTKRTLCRQQVRTGFYTAFLYLCHGLRTIGCDVRVNNFSAAKARPNYPVGLAGYASIINESWLPNPLIFGPGDFGAPPESASLAADPRIVTLIQPSEWFSEIYRPYCGDKIWTWFAGIDTHRWSDLSQEPKKYDFLVYDKITWDRQQRLPEVLGRVTRHLDKNGHSYITLRYGEHHHTEFAQALRQSRAVIFLSQHETQGLACQEAMASNLPILAWDEGEFLDPTLRTFMVDSSHVSSVPYFDEQCGLKFKINDFEHTCERFWQQRPKFTPRHYVEKNLSLELSAQKYLAEYARIAATTRDAK